MEHGNIKVRVQSDPPGILEIPARLDPHLVIHIGRPVEIECLRNGDRHRGISVNGNIDLIPAGVASRWTLSKTDRALLISIPQTYMEQIAVESGIDPTKVGLLNRFQIRDPLLEQLSWLAKSEIDDPKSGRLYLEGITIAMASHLLHAHSSVESKSKGRQSWGMSGSRLRRVLSYIDDNLDTELSLPQIAAESGLSVTHCQRAFRSAVGASIHQYVISQRVRKATALLEETKLSIRDIALEVGFSHPSHLSLHMRRITGNSPARLRRDGGRGP